jgi:hypothetical protein
VPRELIIVSRERLDLCESLTREFADKPDVDVLVDRRRSERRQGDGDASRERRQDERRSYQEATALRVQGFVRICIGGAASEPAEASEVTRTGPPTPQQVTGRMFTWTVSLNRYPPKAWRDFFFDTKDRSIDCMPDKVRFFQAMMIFESDQDTVPTWIQFITRWMTSANQRYARHLEAERRARKVQEDLGRDANERLQEAAAKFRNL